MKIEKLVVGAVMTNCYIVYNENSEPDAASGLRECFVVDPGDYASRILQLMDSLKLECKAILLTHGHFDHIYAVDEIREKTGAPVYAGADEAELLGNCEMNVSKRIRKPVEVRADKLLKDGEVIQPAGITVKTIFTPGHTQGCVCYYLRDEGLLLSGDTLFESSIGRTDLPTGNEAEIFKSITSKLLTLPADTKVYPGHGGETTIERESRFF